MVSPKYYSREIRLFSMSAQGQKGKTLRCKREKNTVQKVICALTKGKGKEGKVKSVTMIVKSATWIDKSTSLIDKSVSWISCFSDKDRCLKEDC